MRDADAALRQMARVTRPGGAVGVCMWDIAGGGMTMLRLFWGAMKAVKPGSELDERKRVGTSEGEIGERLERAGLRDVAGGALEVSVEYSGFDDFWEPFTFAVGPSGQAFAKLDDDEKDAVCEAIRAELPDGPFSLDARAWYATAAA
jgi:ubiquinone/menaquinone biosynthesis C-methylase UbiE